jgi:putative ABC transport system ATP-binding protein
MLRCKLGAVSSTAILRLQNLTKRYHPERPALFENLNLTLRSGEYIAIMGESGAGKSTLLNIIAGLDRPDAGHVFIDDIDVRTLDDDQATLLRRRSMGFVFQAFHVLPYLSVLQNVALPLDLLGIRGAARDTRALDALAAVGLAPLVARYPRELSGGELQRIAIARALVHRPRLLLADEPTGNLDLRTATQVLGVLRAQLRASAASGILITHSRIAAQSADSILMLDARGLHPLGADA